MKSEHHSVSALKLAIIGLRDRINRYRRYPVRETVAALNRASRSVSDALEEIVHKYDGVITRTLLKKAIGILAKAAKVLEKRRPIRHSLNLRWFVAVKQAVKIRYEKFLVLLGEGRAVYQATFTDVAMGPHIPEAPRH
jgi:hypothetical protein